MARSLPPGSAQRNAIRVGDVKCRRVGTVEDQVWSDAAGALLVFSIGDAQSFAALDTWLCELHQQASPNCIVVLVGNKADLGDGREVTSTQAEDFATRHGLQFIDTSAKTGAGVTEAFVRLAMTIVERVKTGDIQEAVPAPTRPPVSRPERGQASSSCPC